MKSVKISLIVAMQNIRKWRTNYRIWILLILTMIFVQCYTKEISTQAMLMEMNTSPWLFPFLYTDRYIRILFMLPLLFIYCDAPFIDKNQIYLLLRCRRKSWGTGQIIYLFMTSAIYFSFVAAMTVVLNIRYIDYMNDWGKVLGTLAFSNIALVKGTAVTISTYILTYFTPAQAMFFTWLLSVLCGGVLGLIIYACNILSKTKGTGIAATGFLIILSAAVAGNERAQWFSPVSWTTLNKLDVGELTHYPTITYVLAAYTAMIIILSICIIKAIGKKDLGVMVQEV
ncbi:MAG: hypothetical protein PHR92_03300 [Lachnospiraceae bacterium]|nr:hypothetical protein [Lachnospiraceae bacterium]